MSSEHGKPAGNPPLGATAKALAALLIATTQACAGGPGNQARSEPPTPTTPPTEVEKVELLTDLYDDPRAPAVYAEERVGTRVSARGLQFIGRMGQWEQAGDAANPPPLTAVRLATFDGLTPTEVAVMLELAVTTQLLVEQQDDGVPPATGERLKGALQQAFAVASAPQARTGCAAPCRPWPWQTRWSVLFTTAHASWRQGARLRDLALLGQSAQLVQAALSAIPAGTHPLTTAVSERLLGAVLHDVARQQDDDATLEQSLAASERALAGFSRAQHPYDWALTQQNIQRTLATRMARSAAPSAVDDALAASERTLAVLGERTPNLAARALLDRSRLFQSRWARSGSPGDLSEAVRLLQAATGTRGITAAPLVTALALARCDLESLVAYREDDEQGTQQALAPCQEVALRPSLPEPSAPEAYRSYGLALARAAALSGDATRLAAGVEQLERAIEAADRLEGRRAGVKPRADYAWSLLQLAAQTPSLETARKAASISTETLALTTRQGTPLEWGQLKELQGVALLSLGWKLRAAFQLPLAVDHYREARAAFNDALGSFSKDDNPRRWADLQRWLGFSYARELEANGQQPPLLNQALACYQRALGVSPRDADPLGYAQAQFGLGSTYLVVADHASRKAAQDNARQSAAAFRLAIEAYQKAGRKRSVANAKAHLADALDLLPQAAGTPSCDAAVLRAEAIAAYPAAQGLWTPAQLTLTRYDRTKLAQQRCPGLPASFWQTPAAPGAKP